jgi:hypothetical protein
MERNKFCIHVDNQKKLLYLEIPKAGCSSIKYELFYKAKYGTDYTLKDIHEKVGYNWASSLEPFKNYFKFTIIRNPFTRFMTMIYFGPLYKKKSIDLVRLLGIDDWPDNRFNDPNTFLYHVTKEILNRNPHTALQTYLLPENLNEMNYIGKVENMEEVENRIAQILGEKIKFPHINKSMRNYYAVKIDVDRFNEVFQEDYSKLKDFYESLKESDFLIERKT